MVMIGDLANHPEKYVTVAELAAYWRVSERTLRYHIQLGSLRATRVGGKWRVDVKDARAFGRPNDIITGPIASAN